MVTYNLRLKLNNKQHILISKKVQLVSFEIVNNYKVEIFFNFLRMIFELTPWVDFITIFT